MRLWRLKSPKILRTRGKLETQDDQMLHLKFEGLQMQSFFLFFKKINFFSPLRPSVDWMRFTQIVEGNVFYSVSTDLNVNSETHSLT